MEPTKIPQRGGAQETAAATVSEPEPETTGTPSVISVAEPVKSEGAGGDDELPAARPVGEAPTARPIEEMPQAKKVETASAPQSEAGAATSVQSQSGQSAEQSKFVTEAKTAGEPKTAAVQSPQGEKPKSGEMPKYPCRNCGETLTWIAQYQRWYCYKCGKYA